MKKQDFIKAIANEAWVTLDSASRVLDWSIEVITNELNSGGDVNITGFGKFQISHRAARNGVNPKTKEAIKIPAMKSPTFKAGKWFKDAISGK